MTFLVLFAALGHAYIWAALVNRSHAVGWSQGLVHLLTAAMSLLAAGIPATIGWVVYRDWAIYCDVLMYGAADVMRLPLPAASYLVLCCACGVWAVLQWSSRMFRDLRQPVPSRRVRVLRLAPPAPGPANPAAPPTHFSSCRKIGHNDACLLARLPLNESLGLEEVDRDVGLHYLPPALDGLRILHLSDIHLSGRIGQWYFAEAVRRCNLREPDLVALTGDFVDEEACIDWIPETVGRLRASWGVYFILGNHDRRVDSQRLRAALRRQKLVDLGGSVAELNLRGTRLVLAGNEVPWFTPAADFSGAPAASCDGGLLRIALAHSPDQLPWARRNKVDLLLTGHTHGGQVCLPWIGPVVTPCIHGVRYTRGVYHVPPTVMHVSKGLSAEIPVRFKAMPEMVILTLHPARAP